MRIAMMRSMKAITSNLLVVLFMGIQPSLYSFSNYSLDSLSHQSELYLDPWSDAVAEAQTLLTNNPDFESNLHNYQSLVDDIRDYIQVVKHVQPALDLVDDLKSMSMLGVSAWDIIAEVLDASVPGASDAIEVLDDVLRQLISLEQDLDALTVLDSVDQAMSDFRADPSQQTLKQWEEICPQAISALADVDDALQEHLITLNDIVDSVSLIQEAFASAGAVPGLGEYVHELNRTIDSIASPVYKLQGDLESLHQQIQDDIEVLQAVQDIVYAAEHPAALPSTSDTAGGTTSRSTSAGAMSSAMPFLIGGLAIAGAIALVFVLQQRGKYKVVSPTLISEALPEIPFGLDVSPPIIGTASSRSTLYMENGPLQGRCIPLADDDVLVGRGSMCSLRIPDRSVSRQHARLRYAQGAWFIQDQGSAAGIIVNGKSVQAARLNIGDQVTVGKVTFTLQGG
jgi:hypothetical protein